ncbi:hypothetical protein [Streptomyces ficellus]|uniref:Uncharacterized protein n=1 Tax=Streptomyces ficellus TaxID=1977088 RepID=A0A6I6F516_9ACTN|nr:hypothetical protein [Streptomyces ficellus]QGV77991.1 hypothetical protein EIZ62_06790 [Streptomyces ficellus]
MRGSSAREVRLNRLWGAVCAFAGVFLVLWAVSWVRASVVHEDLENRCGDLSTSAFPFEKSCVHEDGTVEGANGVLFEGVFLGSMGAAAACLAAVVAMEAAARSGSGAVRR